MTQKFLLIGNQFNIVLNILITGGSGYLAGCLANFLNGNKNYNITLSTSSENFAKKNKFNVFKIDWGSSVSLDIACKNKDVIIHCAGPNAAEAYQNPNKAFEFSSKVLDNLIKKAIKNKVKKLIYFSSVHVYKTPLEGYLNEKSPLDPKHPYGISKKLAELTLSKYIKNENLDINIIRLSNAFGKPFWNNKNCWNLVVNDFCKQVVVNKSIQINSDGNEVRNFVTVNEVCRLVDFIIERFKMGKLIPFIFNFGGSWNLSIKSLAVLIAKKYKEAYGINPKIIFKKRRQAKPNKSLEFSYDLIIKKGFKPRNNYLDDIKQIFNYVKDNFLNA